MDITGFNKMRREQAAKAKRPETPPADKPPADKPPPKHSGWGINKLGKTR